MIARKTFTAAVAALAVSASTLAMVGDAEAGHRRHHHGNGNAGAVIAGVIGGLAIGALVASSSRRARAYDHGYAPVYGGGYAHQGYYGHQPVYGRGYVRASHGYRYANSGFSDDRPSSCFVQKQQVYDQWGNYAGKKRVRVCQ
jgi:hypothetical protein